MTVSIDGHLAAVAGHIATAGIPCERGKPPSGVGWVGAPGQSVFTAYTFVSKYGGIAERWPLLDPIADADPLVNIQAVGSTDTQVEALLDQVRALLDDQTITVPGRHLLRCRYEMDESTFVDRDVTPHVFVGAVRYRVWTEPASSED